MSTLAGLVRRVGADDRGAGTLAAFIVLFSILGVAGLGIIIDSARTVAADRQCLSIAFEAARAGANELDLAAARDGQIVIDGAEANAAAMAAAAAFVSNAGAELRSVTVTGNRVAVTVAATVDPWFPVLSARTVTQTATAEAVVGVNGPISGP